MKAVLSLYVAILFSNARLHADELLLKPGDKVAICGDSITEQKLYSVFVETYLLACQPSSPRPDFMQFGWNGEMVGGLLARMKQDVLWFKPSLVTLCYGMNDGFYSLPDPKREDLYKTNLTATVKELKKSGVERILIASPGCVDSHNYKRPGATPEQYNKQTLARLGEIARGVAIAEGATFADVQKPMLEVMAAAKAKYGEAYPFTGSDGVHPDRNGHLVMAYSFLKALGCSGDIGTITWNADTASAQSSEGHKVLTTNGGVIELESTKYPFCVSGDPSSPDSTSGIVQLFPFNQELNRLTLIVTGLKADHAKVTWGSASKVYTKSQLEKGVNLAADFPENPFSPAFAALQAAVADQQALETMLMKQLIHNESQLQRIARNSYQPFVEDVKKSRAALSQAAAASVKPVRHTITIEALPGDS